MCSSKKILVVTLFALHASIGVAADTTAEEIARINEQIAVQSAQLKELELRVQVATKRAELERAGAIPSAPAGQPADLPVVRSIEGIDGKMKATLAFAGGIQQTVSPGEKIHGGWSVLSIEIAAVTLGRGSEKLRLGFGREPPVTPTTPGGAGQGQYPASNVSVSATR